MLEFGTILSNIVNHVNISAYFESYCEPHKFNDDIPGLSAIILVAENWEVIVETKTKFYGKFYCIGVCCNPFSSSLANLNNLSIVSPDEIIDKITGVINGYQKISRGISQPHTEQG
jgi:hypothetical protein